MSKKKTYVVEKREMTQPHKEALDLLEKAGQLTKPYNSEVLGSFSMHIYAQKNPATGLLDIGFSTISTEMDVKADILQGLLQPAKDMIDRVFGATRYVSRDGSKEDNEERTETRTKLQELGLISPGEA